MPKTVYIRNVPDDVAEQLAKLADREGMSVSAFAARELTRAAQRANNAELLASLPSLDITTEQVLRWRDEGRAGR